MKPLEAPPTLQVFQLVKQAGMNLTNVGYTTATGNLPSLGVGFFYTQHDAEMHRTFEILKLTPADNCIFHIWELTIPNPAYKEIK